MTDLPVVVNAPMAGIAGGALAAAVTAAGGLGFIGGGYGDAAWIDDQLDIAADESVGVGLITWALAVRPGLLEHVLGRGVRWIWLSFGDAMDRAIADYRRNGFVESPTRPPALGMDGVIVMERILSVASRSA